MGSSLKIFTWLGIPVFLHWSFALVLLFPAITFYQSGFSWIETAFVGAALLALFTCVLLHEYGHSIMARRFGVQTRDIILTPIGGIARLERMPEQPQQEILVAIAGPLVNVVIVAVIMAISSLLLEPEHWQIFTISLQQAWESLVQYFNFFGEKSSSNILIDDEMSLPPIPSFLLTLVVMNTMLVLFNLIPAFPMDGGRVFRAVLALRLGRVKATRLAAYTGQVLAVLFVLLGLWKGPQSLLLIGFFIFVTARNESAMVQLDDVLGRFTARDLLRRQYTRLSANDWMQTPIELLHHSLERHFLVFDLSGNLVGMLEESEVRAAAQKRDLSASVLQYMQRTEVVHPTTSLQQIFFLIRQQGNGIIGVGDESGLLGVIDEAGLDYFMRGRKN